MAVNPDTWADDGEIAGVGDLSFARSRASSSTLLESGSMQVEGALGEGWYRVYMDADQGAVERVAMATLNFARTSGHVGHGETSSARGRSVLQPAADASFQAGAVTPAGEDAAAWCAARLAEACPAPVSVSGSFTLVDDYVHAPGSQVLSQVWKVLSAGGFSVSISPMGEISVAPDPTEPALALDRTRAGLLVPGADDDLDLTGVPNRYTAVFPDGEVVTATNEDASSQASRQRRGWWVDAPLDKSPVCVNGESREEYAARRLAGLSVVKRTYRYVREYWPGVAPGSVVRASLAANGLDGDLRVVSQQVTRDGGATVGETAEMEVSV